MPGNVLKVLIAEDDRGVQELLKTILIRDGYVVDCVDDGLEAIRCCTTASYDVIVLDLAMPKASGADVLLHLRETGRVDVLSRIIVVTAASVKEVAGIRGVPVIRKPFDLADLRGAIQRLVGGGAVALPAAAEISRALPLR